MARQISVFLILLSIGPQSFAYNEQQLKTLFTSPSERQAINSTRRGGGAAYVSGSTGVQVKGIVSRSGGKSVVWVNRKNTMENTMVDGVKIYPNAMSKKNKIPIRINGRLVHVKPGETWSEETGVTEDNY